MYANKDYFTLLEVNSNNNYLEAFVDFHKKDIEQFFPGFTFKPELNKLSILILCNMSVAGVVLAHEENPKTLKIGLDFVIPQYRDQKPGKFLYKNNLYYFSKLGYEKLCSQTYSKSHSKYLKKMGFLKNENDENILIKRLIF